MTRSIIDIADMDCTKPSPCRSCHWHIQGIEKNRCVEICQRLSAYRDGLEYNHLPWPELKDLQDVQGTEDKVPPKNEKHKVKSNDTLQKKKKTRDNNSMPEVEKVSAKRIKTDPPKPQKPKKPDRDKVFKIYMSKYPGIIQYIVETAEKSLLPTKDIFIQLLSEAILARKEN